MNKYKVYVDQNYFFEIMADEVWGSKECYEFYLNGERIASIPMTSTWHIIPDEV